MINGDSVAQRCELRDEHILQRTGQETACVGNVCSSLRKPNGFRRDGSLLYLDLDCVCNNGSEGEYGKLPNDLNSLQTYGNHLSNKPHDVFRVILELGSLIRSENFSGDCSRATTEPALGSYR